MPSVRDLRGCTVSQRSRAAAVRSTFLVVIGLAVSVLGVGIFAASASADSARVWLTTSSGATVAENSQLTVRQHVIIHVSGFAPNSTVLFQFGDAAVPGEVTADDAGSATAPFTVRTLRSDAYVLTATSDTAVATFVVTVYNPATRKPAVTAPAATPPKHTTHRTTTHTSSTTTHVPKTLAHTGTPSLGISVAAAGLLLLGFAFLRLGAPVFMGRHERLSNPGRHAV